MNNEIKLFLGSFQDFDEILDRLMLVELKLENLKDSKEKQRRFYLQKQTHASLQGWRFVCGPNASYVASLLCSSKLPQWPLLSPHPPAAAAISPGSFGIFILMLLLFWI